MKILIANPNTSTGVTDRLVAAGRLVASAGTELIPMTAPRPSRRLAERRVGGACGPPRMKRVVRKSLDHGELELFEVMGQALAGAR